MKGMVRVRYIAAAILFLAIPLLYALAAGPLVYLRSTGRPLFSDQTFARLYYPLIRAEAHFPPLGQAMHYYVSWWERPRIPRPETPPLTAPPA